MVRIKSSTELILGLIDFFSKAQPLLDTKPGSVPRDLIIDGPSTQVSRVYEEIAAISNRQSLRNSIGADLDLYAQNFGAVRQGGAKSTGPILLTFSSLTADIPINQGGIITARSGATFNVINSVNISPTFINSYRATASKYRSDLDIVGISDELAIEILVEATSSGFSGNISKYSLVRTSISSISHVTNVFALSGGRDTEDDAAFRNRVFAIFSGANTGTALGYSNAARSDASVIDAIVIEPGDSLMTRDGTITSTSSSGDVTIISVGTGGKVDIYVFGTRIQQVIDSFVYRDLSNTEDPTHPDNDFVLGQIADDAGKTVSAKRLDNLKSGVLPDQPVNSIIQVSGSHSGANFIEKSVDSLGRVTGNFELLKDTGSFAGSPWGFDRLRWISNEINDLEEDKTKQVFNGQDPLSFTDLTEVKTVQQDIAVVNENSNVSASDRSSVQLAHYPTTNVTRVFNATTGERYVVTSQNPDGSGSTNLTGRITISGQTLPSISDVLQIDYTWAFSYDSYFDYDNGVVTTNPRTVGDSIDWGFSNAVRRERVTLMASGSFLMATVTHPITSVISANVFASDNSSVTLSSGELAIVTTTTVSNVVSITRDSDGAELWNTSDADGTFSSQTIFFPTDTDANFGDTVTVVYNAIDVFNATTQGNFNSNVITIVPSATAVAGSLVECSYIANVDTILPATLLPALPAIRATNAFDTDSSTGVGVQPTTHIYSSGEIVSNLRQAPSNLALTVNGSISAGIITVTGTTISGAFDVVFTASAVGLQQNLSAAIRSHLGLESNDLIPSTIRLAKLAKMERVTASSAMDVLSVVNTYDIRGYHIFDNSYVKEESVINATLSTTEIILPDTPDNVTNAPSIGDRFRVTFYVTTSNDSENVLFSKAGTLHTNKKFALVDTFAVSSGFTSGSSASATLTVTPLNQPATKSKYKSFYDYTAPKPNERITISYNYDKLITDVTLAVEASRPINADVLAKASTAVSVDITMNIVVTTAFIKKPEVVRQNVQDAITVALNAQALGTIIDSSDLVQVAYTVGGVDRARVMHFNKSDIAGSVLSIEAKKNEYIQASTVTVAVETR